MAGREPSMEDILASIKKVIAEEKELRSTISVAAPLPPVQPEPDPEESADEEVLELDEPVVETMRLPEVDLGPPLVSEDAAEASRSRLAALQEAAASAPPPSASSVNPLEQMVRDMLRPMLKDWLDQNLPGIVDEHVKREIGRITGQGL